MSAIERASTRDVQLDRLIEIVVLPVELLHELTHKRSHVLACHFLVPAWGDAGVMRRARACVHQRAAITI